MNERRPRILVAVTGASGSAYAVSLLQRDLGDVYLVMSQWGRMVMREETGLDDAELGKLCTQVFSDKDLANPFASGSNLFDAMVVIPCSLGTMAKISAGMADSLITRAALVAMKERRRLVLVVREAPWPTNALENATRLSRDGVVILPAAPPFYHKPTSLQELVDHFVDKVVVSLGGEPRLKWREEMLERD
jgi:4-hydroxy-3-polyprenylbenzoate decarboxylase